MTELRYDVQSLRGDYVRAALGLLLTLGPAAMIPLSSPAMFLLLPAALLFLAFGLWTGRRQATRVVLDGEGISLFQPQRVSLPWTQIRSVRLSYFSTRRDRTGGWMQLTLKGGDPQRGGNLRAIRVDSALEGFDQVARAAAAASVRNGLTLADATRANFGALRIDVAELVPDADAAMMDGAGRR